MFCFFVFNQKTAYEMRISDWSSDVCSPDLNLCPSQLSLNSRTDLEEERRLFYVATTRAEKKLTLTFANTRYRWGSLINCEQSRFIDEIDPKYLEMDIGEIGRAHV